MKHWHKYILKKSVGTHRYMECRCGHRRTEFNPYGYGYQPKDLTWEAGGKRYKTFPHIFTILKGENRE